MFHDEFIEQLYAKTCAPALIDTGFWRGHSSTGNIQMRPRGITNIALQELRGGGGTSQDAHQCFSYRQYDCL